MIDLIELQNWSIDPIYTDFIMNESDNGTIYHLPEFLSYHAESFFNQKQKIHLKFYKKGILLGAIMGVVYTDNDKCYFTSPIGASYGGFVVRKCIQFIDCEHIIDSFLEYLKHKLINEVKLTQSIPLHSEQLKSTYLDFILMSKGFKNSKSDLLLAHKISLKEELISRFEKKTITELKQPLSKNNLQLEILNGTDIETFQLLLDSQNRLNSKPTHSFDDLNKIEHLLPNTINTLKIFNKKDLVAAIIVFHINKKVLNTFYIMDNYKSRDLKANHFSYYNVIKWAKEKGYDYLDFGPSSFGYTPNYPLIKFKEKFDTLPFIRNTITKNIDLQHEQLD